MNEKLTVICLKTGDKYPDEYVTRLRNMVARNLSTPHDFVCFTDKPVNGVDCVPPPCTYPGWWGKVGFFKEALPIKGPMFYLDLDMLVVGSLDELATTDHDFMTMKHWKKKLKRQDTILNYNTSAMYFKYPGVRSSIWTRLADVTPIKGVRNGWSVHERFLSETQSFPLRGDQDWVAHCCPHEATWDQKYFRAFEDFDHKNPGDVRVVVCNVHDPHTVNHLKWVREVWK